MKAVNLKRYPHLLALLPVGFLLCAAVFNYVVDPYRMFSSDHATLYSNYPALHPNLRLHKAYQVNLQKPDTIVLGTSKAIQGIPLDHAYFDGKSMYNLAAPLASMREIYQLFMHAQSNRPLEDVVFVMDFLSFNVKARVDGPAAGYVEARLKTPLNKNIYWPDYLAATVSADALKSSFNVIIPTSDPSHRVLNGRGGREHDEITSRLSDGGHRSNSQKIESFFVDSVLLAAPHRQFALANNQDNSLVWFEKLVTESLQSNIRTTLLVSPSHMRYWALLYQAGLWPQYEQWKKQLVVINEKVAEKLNKSPLPLWDFSLPNDITTERFPIAGDSDTRMKYYYEAVHFNQHTGAMLLDRISGQASAALPENFGVPLNKVSLPAILEASHTGVQAFRSQFPNTVEELLKALPENRGK